MKHHAHIQNYLRTETCLNNIQPYELAELKVSFDNAIYSFNLYIDGAYSRWAISNCLIAASRLGRRVSRVQARCNVACGNPWRLFTLQVTDEVAHPNPNPTNLATWRF